MRFLRAVGSLVRHRGFTWFPNYIWRELRHRDSLLPRDVPIDVILLLVDHFEPSRREGPVGVEKVARWCERYEEIARIHRDSDGIMPQHSWFYRFDYPNYECIKRLSECAYKGFGEIEFHLHHGHDTPETFAQRLNDGIAWFNQAGAMISAEKNPQRRFGYIAGNWALDNGRRDPSMSGVNTELVVLREAGCYADFTFPAFGTNAQPRKTNSIHYSTDTPRPKSYSTGLDVAVGKPCSGDLMIFQGPLYIDWKMGFIEYAAIESYVPYFAKRLEYWLRAGVHVVGRSNWIFVKLHTHGMQSAETLLGHQLENLFCNLEQKFRNDSFRLHYVTAREAYNIVKAAEAGEVGNPCDYRNFAICKPINTLVSCNVPYTLRQYSVKEVSFDIHEHDIGTEIHLRNLPLTSLRGTDIRHVRLIHNGASIDQLKVDGTGECVVQYVQAKTPAKVSVETRMLPFEL